MTNGIPFVKQMMGVGYGLRALVKIKAGNEMVPMQLVWQMLAELEDRVQELEAAQGIEYEQRTKPYQFPMPKSDA